VSGQSLGIYNARNVRGFDPVSLGNVRVNGLYFDRVGGLTSQLIESTSIRVGSTAVSFPFPAPSGIADYRVYGRLLEDSTAVTIGLGPLISPYFETDIGRVWKEKGLSIFGGVGLNPNEHSPAGGHLDSYSAAFNLTTQLSAGLTTTLFWNRIWNTRLYSDPTIYVTDHVVSQPRISGDGVGYEWAAGSGDSGNAGVITDWRIAEQWSARIGVFVSDASTDRGFDQVLVMDGTDDSASSSVYAYKDREAISYSGEAAATHEWGVGVVNRVDLSIRGRDRLTRPGRNTAADMGRTSISHTLDRQAPTLSFTDASDETSVHQIIAGARYQANVYQKVTLSAGLQHSTYDIDFRSRSGIRTTEQQHDKLVNFAVAAPLGGNWTAYSSFSQGLEEGGIAPADAVNRYHIMPIIEGEQIDLGLHYTSPMLSVVAGVFELKKPQVGRDPLNVYRVIGDVRNRGAEASVTARIEGFTIVAGAVLLRAIVNDNSRGSNIQRRPLGVPERQARVDVDYALPNFHRMSVDFAAVYLGDKLVNSDYGVLLGSTTKFDVGARMPLKFIGMPAAVRLQIQNVTDSLSWAVDIDGGLSYQLPRTYSLALTVSSE
jgi:iron complex outermembrane receptor protein